MMSGNLDNLKIAMDDRLHQSYRAKLIPHMEDIFAAGEKFGAKASYLSGAGSTLMAVLDEKDAADFEKKMSEFLSTLPHHWKLQILKPDLEGAVVEREK